MSLMIAPSVLVRRSLVVATVVCACSGMVSAVDYDDDGADFGSSLYKTHINDVRIGVSLLPANADITTSSTVPSRTPATVDTYERTSIFEAAGRTSLMWMLPMGTLDSDGGFIIGLEGSYNHYKLPGDLYQPDINAKAWVGTLHMGMTWVVTQHLSIETTGFAGYGPVSFVAGKYGTYWEYGGRGGLFYTWDSGFQVGVHGDYIITRMEQNYSVGANSYEVLVKGHGPFAGASVGWRF
jgi:hypothetical protein